MISSCSSSDNATCSPAVRNGALNHAAKSLASSNTPGIGGRRLAPPPRRTPGPFPRGSANALNCHPQKNHSMPNENRGAQDLGEGVVEKKFQEAETSDVECCFVLLNAHVQVFDGNGHVIIRVIFDECTQWITGHTAHATPVHHLLGRTAL